MLSARRPSALSIYASGLESPASEEMRILAELYAGSSAPLLFRAVRDADGNATVTYLSRDATPREPARFRLGTTLTSCESFKGEIASLSEGHSARFRRSVSCGDGETRAFVYHLRLVASDKVELLFGSLEAADAVIDLDAGQMLERRATNNQNGVAPPLEGFSDRRKVQRQLLAAVTHAPISIMITDPDGTIIYVNPFFEETTGYSAEEILGKSPRILKSEENDPALYVEMWSRITAGKTWQGELINRKKDGTLYRERSVLAPILNREGVVTAIVGLKEDITAEHTAVERYRREERRFRSLFENAGDAILIHGFDGLILEANQAAVEQTGYSREEIIGLPIGALDANFGTAPPEEMIALMNAEAPQGSVRLTTAMRRKDGTIFPTEVTVFVISREDGGLIGASVRDISERESTLLALTEIESRFSGLIRTAPIGILHADEKGTILEANSALAELLHLSKHRSLTGANLLHSPIIRKEGLARFFSDCLDSDDPREREHLYRSPSGRELCLRIVAKRVSDNQGNATGLIAIIEDITRRRQDEQAIARSLREKETLIQELHHRVKNNLQSVASLLRLQMGSIESEADRKLFESNLSRIHSMAMVHQMLYSSSDLESIDFLGYLWELCAFVRSGSGTSCRIDVGGVPFAVNIARAVPLGLLVNELLANSLEHALPESGEQWIKVETFSREGAGGVRISDSGDGEATAILESRTGFGLSLVTLLAGQIDAEITPLPGAGCRVEILFPLPGSGAE